MKCDEVTNNYVVTFNIYTFLTEALSCKAIWSIHYFDINKLTSAFKALTLWTSQDLNKLEAQSEEQKRAQWLNSKVNPQWALGSVHFSTSHRVCCFSGDISFPRISIGCLSKQRERIHSSLSFHYKTDCELEVEQDKRENSRTNTARFKPADLSPLLKGESKWDCGVFVAAGRKIQKHVHACACHQDIADDVACIRGSQSGIHDFQQNLLFLDLWSSLHVCMCGESEGSNHSPSFYISVNHILFSIQTVRLQFLQI